MLDDVFLSAIRTRELRKSMFVATIVFLATAYACQQVWGNYGFWIAMMVLMPVRAATLGLQLKRIFAQL
ncbi:hypothetical protein [Sinorhizobium sp. A49]|uniref:hypothetical protein n=1 Tax=Sinorhizobium sp. A49 TaxID=1945861 RepID=UPI0009841E72|nr:hypothetical protein [Sinorhizobium sp. A49]